MYAGRKREVGEKQEGRIGRKHKKLKKRNK